MTYRTKEAITFGIVGVVALLVSLAFALVWGAYHLPITTVPLP